MNSSMSKAVSIVTLAVFNLRPDSASPLKVKYVTEAVTDKNGKYTMKVVGDHEDELCDVAVVHSPREDCNEPGLSFDSARVVCSKNVGIPNPTRYANPLFVMQKAALPGCKDVLDELAYWPLLNAMKSSKSNAMYIVTLVVFNFRSKSATTLKGQGVVTQAYSTPQIVSPRHMRCSAKPSPLGLIVLGIELEEIDDLIGLGLLMVFEKMTCNLKDCASRNDSSLGDKEH
ncbi:Anther-specific protein LAT52 [Capsicum annuum]|nr:Anther-specific protein LAT52 [Capsicum annuum]